MNVYSNPNIGIFLRSNDSHVLIPQGLSKNKVNIIKKYLDVSSLTTSIGGSHLIGALTAMNNNAIMVSKLTENYEIKKIEKQTGLNVVKLESKFTAIGNLIAANDKGAIVSTLLTEKNVKQISESLQVPVKKMNISSINLVGALINATNKGAIVHPGITEKEISIVSEVLKVNVEPATVNSGTPYVSSGIIANSKNILVGNQTSGPELLILSKAFGI